MVEERQCGAVDGAAEAVEREAVASWQGWQRKSWWREELARRRRKGWRKVLAVAETVRAEEREGVTREAAMEREEHEHVLGEFEKANETLGRATGKLADVLSHARRDGEGLFGKLERKAGLERTNEEAIAAIKESVAARLIEMEERLSEAAERERERRRTHVAAMKAFAKRKDEETAALRKKLDAMAAEINATRASLDARRDADVAEIDAMAEALAASPENEAVMTRRAADAGELAATLSSAFAKLARDVPTGGTPARETVAAALTTPVEAKTMARMTLRREATLAAFRATKAAGGGGGEK